MQRIYIVLLLYSIFVFYWTRESVEAFSLDQIQSYAEDCWSWLVTLLSWLFLIIIMDWTVVNFCCQTGAERNEASSDMGSDTTQRARRCCIGRRIQRLSRFWRQRRTTFCRRLWQLEYQRYRDNLLSLPSMNCTTVSHCVTVIVTFTPFGYFIDTLLENSQS